MINGFFSNDDLYEKFYYVVNRIIIDIQTNTAINKYLALCEYYPLNINDKNKYILPITICLGSGGYIQYNHIFKNEKLIDSIKLKSKEPLKDSPNKSQQNLQKGSRLDLYVCTQQQLYK